MSLWDRVAQDYIKANSVTALTVIRKSVDLEILAMEVLYASLPLKQTNRLSLRLRNGEFQLSYQGGTTEFRAGL